jgi:hypothetical protein
MSNVPDIAANIFLACLHVNEPGSFTANLREHLINDITRRHRHRFAAARLDCDELLGTKYAGLPYIWTQLRQQPAHSLTRPVMVEELWAELHRHLNNPELSSAFTPVGVPHLLDRAQYAAVAHLVTALETRLTEWATQPDGIELFTAWIPADIGSAITTTPPAYSPLLNCLHPNINPLPAWVIPHERGYWLAAVIPTSIYRLPVTLFTTHQLAYTRNPLTAAHLTNLTQSATSNELHATVGTYLALSYTGNPDRARTFTGLNPIAQNAISLFNTNSVSAA